MRLPFLTRLLHAHELLHALVNDDQLIIQFTKVDAHPFEVLFQGVRVGFVVFELIFPRHLTPEALAQRAEGGSKGIALPRVVERPRVE